ncbi:T9SS type A sorting domain-containing protein [Flavobacterium sp. SUN052]|uniref:T9SS type A sorting domain-containing protein n=1 Tax=Flavobacterium sp. SUN052 TaxID=3002441 RepID=UPI00237E2A4D|nr:T9SS type A sorting domain-containing protein [Flavobacterium sp. SUN052]MEC4004326.1 T9SS type A sorting domain-containing protein [Flavobacterium sp. SUN052]
MKKLLLLSIIVLMTSTNFYGQSGTGCWRMVSAGENFSLGIKMDGTLWGWGQNSNRLGLGLGNLANQNMPIQIGTANDWSTVSAGNVHSLAVKTNGTLWSWGNGQFGQLGNGVFSSATPNVTQIGTATDWLTVSAGNRFSLAIKTTGTLWSWGWNNVGQLGINNLVDQNLPVQVGTSSNWFKIDAGNKHSLAIDNSGFIYAWGDNTFGQFGNGTNTSSLFPILVSSSNNWAEVSAGFDHSMALNTSGILYTFGNNTNGQLCDGTNTASNTMIPVSFSNAGLVSQYIAISAGNSFSLAIKNDNTLWSGGFNTSGQLGLGNNTAVNILNQVGTSNTYFAISAGDTHSLVMETSTALWSTGRGLEGELGIGTNVANNTLQSVGCPTSTLATNVVASVNLKATVYPNPTNGIVNVDYNLVDSSNVIVRLTNIQGQIVSETKMDKLSGFQSDAFDLSSQSNGMYFLNISNTTESFTVKIVKQ